MPVGVPRAALLYVHPWAEEMNKSRRMAALQSAALCRAGFAVLQVDLLGCGDSSGDFGDATWAGWVDDVEHAAKWLQAQHAAPLWLWGLRAGALLAVQAAQRLAAPARFVFWQPPPAGKPLLQQFLRLKAAADLQGGQASAVISGLRATLAAGGSVEVAGYRVAADLASGFEAAALAPPPVAAGGQVVWLETSPRADTELLPASQPVIERWRAAGVDVTAQVVQGPPFWQTVEIEVASALIDATLAALLACTAPNTGARP